MVKRVYGRVEGQDVIFTLNHETGLWTCVVPPTLDGEYIVDLYAEDEAGNVSYLATILFTVDSKNLVFSVKWLKWYVELESRDFKMELYSSCKER